MVTEPGRWADAPALETPRLWLRPPVREDFPEFARFCAEPQAMRFLGGVQPEATAWRSFATLCGHWWLHGYGMFSLRLKENGAWIGRAGPWHPQAWPGREVGWGLHPDYWGQGLAAEAARALTGFAFDTLGWDEVIHCIEPDNLSSSAVARRLGARPLREADAPAPFSHIRWQVWGQSAADWRGRNPPGTVAPALFDL